jgi:hypothetical protein
MVQLLSGGSVESESDFRKSAEYGHRGRDEWLNYVMDRKNHPKRLLTIQYIRN